MDCEYVQNRLVDYLLGEVSIRERDDIRAHLADCVRCAEEERRLRSTITAVEDSLNSGRAASPDFVDRVMARLPEGKSNDAQNGLPIRSSDRSPAGFRARWPVWALAASIALVSIMVWQAPWKRPLARRPSVAVWPVNPPNANRQAEALPLKDLLMLHRQSAMAPVAYDVASSNAAVIGDALRQRVGYPVTQVDLSRGGASLEGARVARIAGGRLIATAYFRYAGKMLSVYELDGKDYTLPKLREMNKNGRRIMCGANEECRFVAWRSGQMLYVMVGNVPDRQLMALAMESTSEKRYPAA